MKLLPEFGYLNTIDLNFYIKKEKDFRVRAFCQNFGAEKYTWKVTEMAKCIHYF